MFAGSLKIDTGNVQDSDYLSKAATYTQVLITFSSFRHKMATVLRVTRN